MARGRLRLYLGAAPGVGKTFAMLDEGWRGHSRGKDVVVGVVVHHNRPKTEAQIRDLEVIPERLIEYRGATFTEMDVDAVIARRPQVALIDELAHTNIPGSRNEKRWQDVEEILDAGIDVISTVNIQHLESLNDVVNQITGVVQRETVPDAVVRAADQIELVDMSPEALRRRMAHGNIYGPEKVDAALGHYFRVGNLTALRELALLWVADRVEDSLQRYLTDHGISEAWETRERIVVALTGAPGGSKLIRRAARMASRNKAELLGVNVRSGDGLVNPPSAALDRHRDLLVELGGSYREVAANDPVEGLLSFARSERATQIVLGSSHRSRISETLRGSVINGIIRQAGDLDVHVISTTDDGSPRAIPASRNYRRPGLSRRRQVVGWGVAAASLTALTVVLSRLRTQVTLPGDLLLFLAVVVGVATIGGTWPGIGAAIVADLLVNWYFTPPLHTFTIGDPENILALGVFLGVSGVVSWLVGFAARRSVEAARGRSEAAALVQLAGAMLTERDPLVEVIAQLRATFGFSAVSVLRRTGEDWSVLSATGDNAPTVPEGASDSVFLDERTVLAVAGDHLGVDDRQILRAFTDQLAVALHSRELQAEAATVELLAHANELRTALLQAVSHDLRTPLASIKASATTLLGQDVTWTPETVRELLETIDVEADRLNELIGNLLDMSRLQSGALELTTKEVSLEEVVLQAIASLGDRVGRLDLAIAEDLPAFETDPALLERALANVIDNAARWSRGRDPVRVEAAHLIDTVVLRVVDRGPGIPVDQRDRVFQPFQRLGDQHTEMGVGLGLAVARGFVDALGGELTVEDTPGGGTTMVFSFSVGSP